ncbi:uncharacterized protein IL334_007693 [Kwoniella shivajii]|uniref:Thioesterase domain-containing protein n=1 Tax=Kwoniella shivajii TaxID=564305 RepID=A0ABZ1D9Y5_9TREE|nr:hypothetical protein IL334_007693 [Kwoniella shivajii]
MACLKFLQKCWSTTLSKGGHDSNVLSSLRLVEARPKYLKGVFTIEQKHLNNHGTIHGGVILSLTDTITSLSLSTLGFPPPTGVSVNISTEFVRPGGTLGSKLVCVGIVEQCGRNLAYTRCEFSTPSPSNNESDDNKDKDNGDEEKGNGNKIGKLVAYGSQTKFMGGWNKDRQFSQDGQVALDTEFSKDAKL